MVAGSLKKKKLLDLSMVYLFTHPSRVHSQQHSTQHGMAPPILPLRQPSLIELRHDLAAAYSSLGRDEDAEEIFVEVQERLLPRMGAEIPLISKEIGLVSAPIPLVSATIPKTLPRHWGFLPSRHWGRTGLSTERRRTVKRPTDIGLMRFLGKVLTAPIQPLVAVGQIGEVVDKQTGGGLKHDKQEDLSKELEESKK